MLKIGYAALLSAAIALQIVSPPTNADAQIEVATGNESLVLGGDVKPMRALRITLSGELQFDYVFRNERYFDAALGNAIDGAAGNPLGWDATTIGGDDGDYFLMPLLTLHIDTQLAEGVNAMVTLATPFNAFGANVGGSDGGEGRDLEVDEAYVQWMGAFVPDLTLVLGVQDYSVDFSGNGNPFFLHVGEAESAFGNPVATAGADFGSPQSSSSGSPGSLEAAGALGQLNMGDAELDLFYFTLNETFRSDEDETLFGAVFEYEFETKDWLGNVGLVMVDLQSDASSSVWTWGGGGSLESAAGDLRVYGEAYGQFGRYRNNLTGFGRITQDRSFALLGGVRYFVGGMEDVRPWIDLSYTEISGDDNGNDDDNGNFVSLEANNDTIIVEDSYYGLDIDTNYRALKFKGGLNLTDDWSIEGLYAYFELQDNSNGTASNSTSSDKLGDEIDIILNYRATDYLSFQFGSGWLFNANALGVGSNISVTVLSAEIRF